MRDGPTPSAMTVADEHVFESDDRVVLMKFSRSHTQAFRAPLNFRTEYLLYVLVHRVFSAGPLDPLGRHSSEYFSMRPSGRLSPLSSSAYQLYKIFSIKKRHYRRRTTPKLQSPQNINRHHPQFLFHPTQISHSYYTPYPRRIRRRRLGKKNNN